MTTLAARRASSVALGRIEARHSVRSPILWIGLIVAVATTIDSLRGDWPVMPWAAALAYHHGEVLGVFAILAGARLGLRDHTNKTAMLITTAPAGQARVRAARLGGLAVSAALCFVLLELAGIVAAVAAGAPTASVDWLLTADGIAGTILACWLGYGVGSAGSALLSLAAAPAYLAATFMLGHYTTISYLRQSVRWLLPVPPLPDWSADSGFLPNIFPLHLGYLAGLLLLTGGAIVAWPEGWPGRPSAHRERAGRMGRGATAAIAAGLGIAVGTGVSLQALPDRYQIEGPAPASWIRSTTPRASPRPPHAWSTPTTDDHRATACTGGPALRVCVYPAYGLGPARVTVAALAAEAAALRAVTGRPELVRMVPLDSYGAPCASWSQPLLQETPYSWAFGPAPQHGTLISCALPEVLNQFVSGDHPMQAGVAIWLLIRAHQVTAPAARVALTSPNPPDGLGCLQNLPCTPQYAQVLQVGWLGFTRADLRVWLAMAALPAAEVTVRLHTLWPAITAGTLPLSELPGQAGSTSWPLP